MPAWKSGSLLPRQDDKAIVQGIDASMRVPATGIGHVRVTLPDDQFDIGMGMWGLFFKFDFEKQVWKEKSGADLNAYRQSMAARTDQ